MSVVNICLHVPDSKATMLEKFNVNSGGKGTIDTMAQDKLFGDLADGSLATYERLAIGVVEAMGTITLDNATPGDTITINGVVFTATASGATGNQFNVGTSTSPSMLSLANVGVLAATTISNTGSSTVQGDVDLSPGTSVTGFPPGTYTGNLHIADATALQAQNDLTTLYTAAQALPGGIDKSGIDLGTLTLTAGVYKFTTSAQLTGTLVLDGAGNPNSTWTFQIGSTLTTASASAVSLINGAQASNITWAVGSSATIGTTSDFKGNIMAQASITLTTGALVDGRLLARTGAVTLDTNTASLPIPTVVPNDTVAAANLCAAIHASVTPLIHNTVSCKSLLNVVTLTMDCVGAAGNLGTISASGFATVTPFSGGADGTVISENFGYGAS